MSDNAPIASPYVEITVPLDTLNAGLAQAETTVEQSGLRMGQKMSASLVEGVSGLGDHLTFSLTPALDKLAGDEADGPGHGFGGMRYQLHAVTSSMALMGVEGNRAIEGLGLALSHIVSSGFNPLGIGLAAAIGGIAAFSGKQESGAKTTEDFTKELSKLNDELDRMKALTHDLATGQKTAEILPLEQARLVAFDELNKFRDQFTFRNGRAGLPGQVGQFASEREALDAGAVTEGALSAIRAYNIAADMLAEKQKQIGESDAIKKQTDDWKALTEQVNAAAAVMDDAYKEKQKAALAALKVIEDAEKKADSDELKRLNESQSAEDKVFREQQRLAYDREVGDGSGKKDSASPIDPATLQRFRAALQAEVDAKVQAEKDAQKAIADVRAVGYQSDVDRVQAQADKEEADLDAHYAKLLETMKKYGQDSTDLEQSIDDAKVRIRAEAAHKEALLGDDFGAGFKAGIVDAERSMDSLGRVGGNVAMDLKGGFENVFASVGKGAKGMEDAMIGALDAIEQRMLKFVGDQAFAALFGKADASGNLSGGIASIFGQGVGSALSPSQASVNANNLNPTVDAPGDVGSTWAFAKSARAGDIHLHNYGEPMNAKVERRQTSSGEEIHVTLEKMMAGAVARGGPLATAVEQRWNLQQQPRHR